MREWLIGPGIIELLSGDITATEADALVTAANAQLAGGGGVDGAIHQAGGPSIMEEVRRRYPQGCPTGQAVVTEAGDLPARWVIHAVASVWEGGNRGEADQLRSAYAAALARATEAGAKSVALPSLGTGIFGNPLGPSAVIAIEEAARHLQIGDPPLRVLFVLFNQETMAAFEEAVATVAARAERA